MLRNNTGCSRNEKCPVPCNTASPEFGILSSINFPSLMGVAVSLSPQMSSVSCLILGKSSVRSSFTAITRHCRMMGVAFR